MSFYINLKKNIQIYAFVGLISGIFLISGFTYWGVQRNMLNETRTSLHELTIRVMDQIDYWYSERIADMQGWANEKVFVTSTENSFIGEAARKSADIEAVEVAEKSLYFESLSVALPDGKIIVSNDSEEIGTLNVSNCNYFQTALQGKQGVSKVMPEKVYELPYFILALPIKKNEKITGVLIGSINLKRFYTKFILPVNKDKGGSVFLCQSDGMIIAANHQESILKENITQTNWGPDFLSGRKELIECSLNGHAQMIAHALHPVTGWHLGIMTPLNKNRASWLALVTGLLLTGALLALVNFILNQNLKLEEMVSERTVTLHKQYEHLQLQGRALEAAVNAIVITNGKGEIEWVNPAFTHLTGYRLDEVLGKTPSALNSKKQDPSFFSNLWNTVLSGNVWQGELINRRKDGTLYHEEMSITPVKNDAGEISHFIAIKQDISERKHAEASLKQYEVELRNAQKQEAIANLAAGIAHEINTPVQYILSNIQFLNDAFTYFKQLKKSLPESPLHLETGNDPSHSFNPFEEAENWANFEFFMNEAPTAIEQSMEGVDRVKKIVYAMKEFSHPGSDQPIPTDLNSAIQSTITVCRSEWKKVAEMVTDLDPALPLVPCFSSEINQVILNLIVNASHAISDQKNKTAVMGTITISTRCKGDWVEIRVSDNGTGIPESVRDRIFDPFFTTKGIGKGTGLGLSISHSIIEKKHRGKISYETKMADGTTFIVSLPLT